jgi:hypothetical protein
MMLNVRCDNVFLLGESLLLSVEQGQRNAPVQAWLKLLTGAWMNADVPKDSVDMVSGLRRVACRCPPQLAFT